jgi:hypothetical protein
VAVFAAEATSPMLRILGDGLDETERRFRGAT